MTDDELKRLERQIEKIVAPYFRKLLLAIIAGLLALVVPAAATVWAAAEWKVTIEQELAAVRPDPNLRDHLRKMTADMQRDIASIDKEATGLRTDVEAIKGNIAEIRDDMRDVRRVLLGARP